MRCRKYLNPVNGLWKFIERRRREAMPTTNFMSALMLDPRAFMLNPLFCDPAALSLLQQQAPFSSLPTEQHVGGGKIVGTASNNESTITSTATSAGNSFRILDILESQSRSNHSTSSGESEKANTSGENDESLEDDGTDDPSASGRSNFGVGQLHSAGKKARKARTIFTDKQLQELEAMFEKHKYLSVQDRMDLAHRMGLTDTQVKTWYQNRRTKWKRQAAVGVDLLQEPSNFAVIQNLLRTNPYWVQQCMANPSMYPFLAQRLMPGMAGVLSGQQQFQTHQSPSSRPQSTNNNCPNNSVASAGSSSPTAIPQVNPFPLFFAGLNPSAFGIPNTTINSSNSANSSSGTATPNVQAEDTTSDNESKTKATSPVEEKYP